MLLTAVLTSIAPAQSTWTPAPTLAEDLETFQIKLREGYARRHPRLLFTAADKSVLQAKAKAQPALWKNVKASAAMLRQAPTPEEARVGAKYWRIERAQAGSLVWFLEGDEAAKKDAIEWMLIHCREPIWGTQYRPNLDLQASWYLYHIALAYDTLYDALSDDERKIIRDGLASHAKAIFDGFDPVNPKDKIRYDQNHTYIPATALAAASLALVGDVPEADEWLKRSYAVLRRCRYVSPEDGYYYEGFGYWSYALHWHVRYADLVERATGERLHDLPALKDNWRFALHMQLPAKPGAFDVGDGASYSTDKPRGAASVPNYAMLWGLASSLKAPAFQLAGNNWGAVTTASDYPTAAFLWFDPTVVPAAPASITPYEHFKDMDVITWRSGWDENATAYHFRCGPPLGHTAFEKTKILADWTMNCGHVHPDIGAFVMHARGAHLAVTTGYTAEKWTKDHNTLLVDEKGQAIDGSYHNERGYPYEQLNACRIDRVHLTDAYAYASGELGGAYQKAAPGVQLRRSVVMSKDFLLVIDDIKDEKAPRTLTWSVHTDGAFETSGEAYVARLPNAGLAVVPLTPALVADTGPTTVIAGTAPGKGVPTQRGFELTLATPKPVHTDQIVTLLVPLSKNEAAPKASFASQGSQHALTIEWSDGRKQEIKLNGEWGAKSTDGEPVTFTQR